jgi:hypothetical protein
VDELVLQRWDAGRPRTPIAFRDVHAPHRLRVAAAVMNAILLVEQASVEVLAGFFARAPLHSGRRAPTQALVRLLQRRHIDRAQQVVEPLAGAIARASSSGPGPAGVTSLSSRWIAP